MKTIDTLALIDDDETYQFIAKHTIMNLNIVDRLKIFSNGKEAIDYLRSKLHDPSQLPDVILLDLNMPVMDGWDFLERYLMLQPRIGKKIHIYIVTSSVDPVDVERANRINAVTDYFVKPLTRDKLVSILESIV
jgi:CheY-like chemotaxis protein